MWPIVQWSKMSVRSAPVADKLEQQNDQETLSEGRLGTQLRRSSRVKVPSNTDFESRTAKRANTLKHSCAGYVATLTRLRGNIQGIIDNCGTLEDLQLKRDSYEEAWRRFVNTHGEYIECLDVLSRYEDVERADANYKEQMSKKATFDNEIETWKFQVTSSVKKRENDLKSYPRRSRKSTKSVSTGSSSASLAVATKKEELALTQLKTKQVLQEQQLQGKLSELRFEKDMLEAKMEEERAKASLNVYKEFENQCRKSQYRERLAEFIHYGNQAQNVAQSQLIEQHEQLVQEHAPLEQVPALRDNERIMNSAAKTFQPASVTVPNPVFSKTEHTVYVDEAGTGKHTEQLNNAKDTEALRNPPVIPSVLNLSQQVQTPLTTHFNTKEYSQWPTQVLWSQTPGAVPAECYMREPVSVTSDSRAEIVQALRQVVSAPRIEYMRFDGDPIKYVSFMHNFETCLEKYNPDNSRRLQLLIQHCYGKARDAIESCVNLPVDEGYHVAKSALRENFGLPHIIAKAHIKKLEDLPPLKQADGASLLEFSRHLDVANRTLSGMGPEYVSDLNHTNTLRELNKKLPQFMRVKWT